MNIAPKKKTESILFPALLLAAAVCLFYSPYLFGGRPLFSTNFYQFLPWKHFASSETLRHPTNSILSDPLVYFLPIYMFVQRSLHNFVIPMWNPYLLCGYPLIADGTIGFFYPVKWALFLLHLPQMFTFAAVLRIFLAGFFMLIYLREMKVNSKAALFGAICFMFNGFFIVWNEFPTLIESAIWLPLMFFLVEKVIREEKWKYFLLLGATIAMSILAGMFQIALYNIYATGMYMLWRGIEERKRFGKGRLFLQFGGFGAAVAVALALSAVQILPFYEFISNTHREKIDLKTEFFPTVCPPEFLVQYIIPEFYGSHPEKDFWFLGMAEHMNDSLKNNPGWSSNLTELNGFTGAITLLLALIAIRKSRRSQTGFFILLALLSILPVFSKSVLSFYYYAIPGFKTSWAGRLSYIYMLAVICLASFGLDKLLCSREDSENDFQWLLRTCCYVIGIALLYLAVVRYFKGFDTEHFTAVMAADKSLPERLRGYYIAILASAYFWKHTVHNILVLILTIGAFAAILLLCKMGRISSQQFAHVLILLAIMELFYFSSRFHPVQAKNLFIKSKSIAFLQQNLGSGRIARFGNMGVLAFDTGLCYGLRDSQGYLPLIVDRVSDYLRALDERAVLHERWAKSFTNLDALDNQMFDMLGVRYLVTDLKTEVHDIRFLPVFEDGIKIFECRNSVPRASFVHEYKVLPKEAVLQALVEKVIDIRKTVLLEEEPAARLSGSIGKGSAVIDIIEDSPNEVRIQVVTPSDGFLVLSDTFYPGWKAYVDGNEQKIYRANYMFRAVPVATGTHAVDFRFRPFSLFLGSAISCLTLLATLATMLVSSLMSQSRQKSADLPSAFEKE